MNYVADIDLANRFRYLDHHQKTKCAVSGGHALNKNNLIKFKNGRLAAFIDFYMSYTWKTVSTLNKFSSIKFKIADNRPLFTLIHVC